MEASCLNEAIIRFEDSLKKFSWYKSNQQYKIVIGHKFSETANNKLLIIINISEVIGKHDQTFFFDNRFNKLSLCICSPNNMYKMKVKIYFEIL